MLSSMCLRSMHAWCGRISCPTFAKRSIVSLDKEPKLKKKSRLGGVSQIFLEFSSRKLGKFDPIWRLHIFQMGWFNHQLELQLQKNFALNNLTAIPLCSFIEVNPTNEHWKPMVFSDIFWWGFRFFRLSCTSKTWTNVTYQAWCDFQKRPYREQISRLMIFTYVLGSKHPFFFQLQGNLNNAWHLSTIGTWGAILESILKTRFRTAEAVFAHRHGPWFQDWYGPWKGRRHGQRKGRWEPRGETARRTNGWDSLSF